MCKFHKDVAAAVAIDPYSGDVDPVRYSLALCALARFWVNKYMPAMGHLDGYSNYELSTDEPRQAFYASGLEQDLVAANDGNADRITFIRSVIDDYITTHRIDGASLNLPTSVSKNSQFLDEANGDIYGGNPAFALDINSSVKNSKHEPLRVAMETLYQRAGFIEAIEGGLKTSISNLFIDAPRHVNQAGLSIYSRIPSKLRNAFASCSLHGGGGALAHVVVCGGLNLGIGGFSGAFMNAAMYAVGPVVALGTTYATEKYRKNSFNEYKYILPVMLSLAGVFAVSKVMPHEHSTDPSMALFYSLSPAQRHEQLQKDYQRYLKLPVDLQREVDSEASKQKMTVAMFMTSLEVCGGDITPKITAFEKQQLKKMELSEQRLH